MYIDIYIDVYAPCFCRHPFNYFNDMSDNVAESNEIINKDEACK